MKKQMFVMALGLGAVVLAAGLANAGSNPGTGIRGSVHDLSIRGIGAKVGLLPAINDPQERICIFCHAPHHAYKLTGIVEGTGPESVSAEYT